MTSEHAQSRAALVEIAEVEGRLADLVGDARDEASFGLRAVEDEVIVEYDKDVLRGLDNNP